MYDVIIIGAGAAGLTAARDLSAAGLSIIVLEARSRIGGRIFTQHEPGTALRVELGAEFIHGRSQEIFSILKEANLEFEEVTGRHWFFDDGKLSKSGAFWSAVEDIMAQMHDEVEDRSFHDFLLSLPDGEHSLRAQEMARRFVEGFHAARSERIGIHGLNAIEEISDYTEGDRSFRLLNGYDALTNWLLHETEARGGTFTLNSRVRKLNWQRHAVALSLLEGDACKANAVVITIPLSLLKLGATEEGSIDFSPPLPEWKQQAIQALEMGSAVRVALHFTDRFWENLTIPGTDEDSLRSLGFIHYPDAPLPTWWATLPKNQAILVGWAGGPDAEKLLTYSSDEMTTSAVRSLSQIFGLSESEILRRITKTYFHNWDTDPYSRGGYGYLPVNGVEHQLNLAKPIDDTLFFAGEATSLGNVGTVHGAIQSGQRAAREVLTALGRTATL